MQMYACAVKYKIFLRALYLRMTYRMSDVSPLTAYRYVTYSRRIYGCIFSKQQRFIVAHDVTFKINLFVYLRNVEKRLRRVFRLSYKLMRYKSNAKSIISSLRISWVASGRVVQTLGRSWVLPHRSSSEHRKLYFSRLVKVRNRSRSRISSIFPS